MLHIVLSLESKLNFSFKISKLKEPQNKILNIIDWMLFQNINI